MLSCRQVTEIVTEYLERRMSLTDRMRFWFHLGMCVNCRRYLRQMRITVAALGQLPQDFAIPQPVRDELRQRFASWHQARRSAERTD